MASAIITKLRTENFETWKGIYDRGESMRREHGVRGVLVAQDASQPNLVTVVTRFDSVDAAKKMLSSEAWKDASKGSGSAMLEAFFVDIAEEKTY